MFCRITKRRYGLAPMNCVRVVILNAALGPLDYRAPKGAVVEPGAIVLAPLGPRQVTGDVWEPKRLYAGEMEAKRLPPLLHVYEIHTQQERQPSENQPQKHRSVA